jgi:pimeloyl-ACP methyl ester carboxylesterase
MKRHRSVVKEEPMTTNGIANGATDPNRLAVGLIEDLPVTARRLEVAGVSTWLLEGGDGPPMVLVHGQGGFAEIMAPLIQMVVDRYRAVVSDLPGMGRSEVRTGSERSWPG